MSTAELYEVMVVGYFVYTSYVHKQKDQGMHNDYMFKMTLENIANFIGRNVYTANKIIMTGMFDSVICESAFGEIL